MNPSIASEPALAQTAVSATLSRLRPRLARTVVFIGLLCLAIALLLTAIEGQGFGSHLIYSLCIGSACMAVADGTRLTAAALVDCTRAWRGLQPSPSGFDSGWRGVAPAVIVAPIMGPLIGMWLGDQITGYNSASLLSFGSTSTRFTLAMSVLGTLISVFVLSTLERLSSARALAEAAQRLAAENQLRLLQSQLEPHMLFNTLANLRVLIGMDPPRAQAMLDRLIAFLRATLNASRTAAHPLAAEFTHLGDYLALMAVRMGPRLAVQLDLPPALATLQVPPLLLQPLVENAIKHGLEPKVEGGRIEVGARLDGNVLQLTVRDTGVGLNANASAGSNASASASAGTAVRTSFGLEQVRTRLTTLFGAAGTLVLQEASDAEGGAVATLHMPAAWPRSS